MVRGPQLNRRRCLLLVSRAFESKHISTVHCTCNFCTLRMLPDHTEDWDLYWIFCVLKLVFIFVVFAMVPRVCLSWILISCFLCGMHLVSCSVMPIVRLRNNNNNPFNGPYPGPRSESVLEETFTHSLYN